MSEMLGHVPSTRTPCAQTACRSRSRSQTNGMENHGQLFLVSYEEAKVGHEGKAWVFVVSGFPRQLGNDLHVSSGKTLRPENPELEVGGRGDCGGPLASARRRFGVNLKFEKSALEAARDARTGVSRL